MRVTHYGSPGAHSYRAAEMFFKDKKVELTPCNTISKVIKRVAFDEYDAGVVPLQNNKIGMVAETLDYLTRFPQTKIIAEFPLKVIHCFGALKGHEKITEVHSKEEAIRQCPDYIDAHYPEAELVYVGDTARAAKDIRDKQMLHAAAIASEKGLLNGGLEVLAKDISKGCITRFAVVEKEIHKREGDGPYKTWIAFHPRHSNESGVENIITDGFAKYRINLLETHSSPDGTDASCLHKELEGHVDDETVQRALHLIRFGLDPNMKYPEIIQVLGSYPNRNWRKCELT